MYNVDNKNKGERKMEEYKCDQCGFIFKSDAREFDVSCPSCGDLDVYTNDEAGELLNLKVSADYENKLNLWED